MHLPDPAFGVGFIQKLMIDDLWDRWIPVGASKCGVGVMHVKFQME